MVSTGSDSFIENNVGVAWVYYPVVVDAGKSAMSSLQATMVLAKDHNPSDKFWTGDILRTADRRLRGNENEGVALG